MTSPDFTELTFGFAFLSELEQKHTPGGRFPRAPEFISQQAEATKGYDVEVTLDGTTPTYYQLKRSYVLVRRNAREIQQGLFEAPNVYRMLLHKNGGYRQHIALQNLEREGNAVFYVTSKIHTSQEFADHYRNRTIVSDASVKFSPTEIQLPDYTQDHHVSFNPDGNSWHIYSDERQSFEPRFPTNEKWIQFIRQGARSAEDNKKHLDETVDFLIEENRKEHAISSGVVEKIIEHQSSEAKAAILSYFILDAQLTFLKPAAS